MDDKYLSGDDPKGKAKYGITTGTGATAATLAAFMVLKEEADGVTPNSKTPDYIKQDDATQNNVTLETPLGKLEIEVEYSKKLSDTHGRASIIKRPYDDPDVTVNIEIFADVRLTDAPGIRIKGGEGVGIVTKPGLQVPVGQPAINPVPQEMIRTNLQKLLPKDKGAEVVISIPGGEELADKTLNPRLGIKGGISILGTTGIARSMNMESYKKSFKAQLDVAVAEGYKELVFVPGNIGEKIARRILDVDVDQIIQMGNLVGYMLSEAQRTNVKHIILLGHAGKIIKIAAGIFNTEHRIADGRKEIITAHTALLGGSQDLLRDIFHSNTTEEMIELLDGADLVESVFNSIGQSIKERCQEKYKGELDVVIVKMDGTVLNSNHNVLLANTT